MAHKKGVGSSKNGRESHSKRLGVKIFGGQEAIAGNVILRQRGTSYHPGKNVGIGKDHTIFALVDGKVIFTTKKQDRRYVAVIPTGEVQVDLKAQHGLRTKAKHNSGSDAEVVAESSEVEVAAIETAVEPTMESPAAEHTSASTHRPTEEELPAQE